jgi:hypothetical protein
VKQTVNKARGLLHLYWLYKLEDMVQVFELDPGKFKKYSIIFRNLTVWPILSRFLLTTAWSVPKLQMEEMASKHGG